MRQGDPDKAHIGAGGETAPTIMLPIAQRRGEIDRGGEIGEAVHFEQCRRRAEDNRRKGRSGDARQCDQRVHVIGAEIRTGTVTDFMIHH